MSMSVESILRILRSDSVDDSEELLTWLATDGVTVLEEYADLRKRLEEAARRVAELEEFVRGYDAYIRRVCRPRRTEGGMT